MFKAAAPENVRRLLSHKDQTRLTVEEAYKVFFTDHRMEIDKKATQIHTVSEEQEFSPSQSEQDIATFKPQQRQQQRPQQNYNNRDNNCSSGQNYRSNNNNRQNHNQPRTNAARNGKFCIYCKIMNHTQEECSKQINDNKPCVTNKGHMYWPKINTHPIPCNRTAIKIVESDFDPTVFH